MHSRKKHLWRFVLLAFLLNAVLPFFAVYDAAQLLPNRSVSALFGNRVLICTGDGFRWVTRDKAAEQPPHHPASHYECALCFAAAHGLKNTLLPSGAALAFAARFIAAVTMIAATLSSITYASRCRHSRAPPSLSY